MDIDRKDKFQDNGICIRLKLKEVTKLGLGNLQLLGQKLEIGNSSNQQTNGVNDKNKPVQVVLEGSWSKSLGLAKDSIVHLIDPVYDSENNVYTIDNSKGLLIVEPDNLITCTAVASTTFCERKTWLNHVFQGQVGTNRAMLVGTLVHEVFQYGVRNKNANLEALTKYLDELLDDATVMLETYSVELHMKDVRSEAVSYLNSVKEWIEKYMLSGPQYPLTDDPSTEVKVVEVTDIEENVWSTKYGLKGKIDVTGSVRVHDKKCNTVKLKTLPLELKTGNPNPSLSHRAQVSLYTMMIEDRYAETNQGLLIYLKNRAAMYNVSVTRNERNHLVQRRNDLNYYMRSYYFGPETIDKPRMCQNCERLTECVLMLETYDHNLSSEMMSLRNDAVGHLDGKFRSFFMKYHEKLVRLMSQPQSIVNGGDKSGELTNVGSFWTYSSSEAESKGTGFGKLKAIIQTGSKTNLIKFIRHPDYKGNHLDDLDANSPRKKVKRIKIDDYFKPKSVASAGSELKPFNTEFNFARYRIAISLDEDSTSMDSQNSSTAIAIGFMQELKENEFTLKIYEGAPSSISSQSMYRIDRIEKKTNLDIERLVLVRLLARGDWRCDRVRQLVLDPEYKPVENVDTNLFVLSSGFEEITELACDLQKPVIEAISTDNYFIINETHIPNKDQTHKVVSSIIQVIRSIERTVLIVAQNIDHLVDLMRRIQKKCRFILIDDGKSTKARFQFATHLVKVPQDDNMDLMRKFDSYIKQHEMAPVVITTYAMSIGGLLFTRRTFDYCIAYDCDNTELLVSLSPMFCSDRHIIIDVKGSAAAAHDNTPDRKANEDVTLGEHLRRLRKQVPVIELN
jgi:CRISPR/Cas system-associated exonuclease Cas4 (RecB family)